jgi:uncharacterized protein (DUF1330 family)
MAMVAYVIASVAITDQESYRAYQQRVPATVEQYGGRFLVRGGRREVLEGDAPLERLIVVEFPSFERAREWYASPEYQAIVPIRQRHSQTHFITVVEGV